MNLDLFLFLNKKKLLKKNIIKSIKSYKAYMLIDTINIIVKVVIEFYRFIWQFSY